MRTCTRWALVLLLAGTMADARPLAAQDTELSGDVIEVLDRTVRIRVVGDLLPRVGDAVRIRFRDPVPGVGLTFLQGSWEVSEVGPDYVTAVPAGDGAEPQTGQVAVIASPSPQARADVARQAPARAQDPAAGDVAAVARERDDGETVTIDRRRWFSISAGTRLVGMNSPVFQRGGSSYEPASDYRPGYTAAAGLHLLSRLAVGGYLGSVGVDAATPDGLATWSVTEVYRGLGATLYVGTPGNVAGDVYGFVQGARLWYDVFYGGAAGDPDVTGTGTMASAGMIFTIRRGLGAYVSGHYFTAEYDQPGAFDHAKAEVGAGLTIVY